LPANADIAAEGDGRKGEEERSSACRNWTNLVGHLSIATTAAFCVFVGGAYLTLFISSLAVCGCARWKEKWRKRGERKWNFFFRNLGSAFMHATWSVT
jgi:hypothetical protein